MEKWLLILLFSHVLLWLPPALWEGWRFAVLPALTLGLAPAAGAVAGVVIGGSRKATLIGAGIGGRCPRGHHILPVPGHLLGCGGKTDHLSFIHSERNSIRDLRFPSCKRSGFVEDHRIDLGGPVEGRKILHEHPLPGGQRDARHPCQGHRHA